MAVDVYVRWLMIIDINIDVKNCSEDGSWSSWEYGCTYSSLIYIYIYTWLNFKDGSTLSNMPTRMFNLHCSLPRHHGSMNARTV